MLHGAEQVESTGGTVPGTKTILLVEDDRRLRAVLAAVLHRSGYRVLDVADADGALSVCRDENVEIDLILTDVLLPKVNGPELAGKLNTLRPGAKVLLMSGYLGIGSGESGLLDPRTPFLRKPFTPSELAIKVREVLAGTSPQGE